MFYMGLQHSVHHVSSRFSVHPWSLKLPSWRRSEKKAEEEINSNCSWTMIMSGYRATNNTVQ